MIPAVNGFLSDNVEIQEQTSQTYKMDFNRQNIRGMTDKLEAMRQLVHKILNTERYQHAIYSWDFGVELADLYGQPVTFILPELKRRISEALTADSRIERVDNFDFAVENGRRVTATFTVHTVFGTLTAEKGVDI